MTIKTRSNINLGFIILCSLFFVISLFLFIYQGIHHTLSFPAVFFQKTPGSSFLLGYKPKVIIYGLIYQLIYTIVFAILILRNFSKTQSSIIVFFLIFLLAIFADSFRLIIPFYHFSNSYSQILLAIGNITLFSRILAPISLLVTAILNFDEQPQKTNQYCIILLSASLILAAFIPLNTAKLMPNFLLSYGYSKTLHATSIIISFLSIITNFISNYVNENKQITSYGYLFICVGFNIVFVSSSPLMILIGYACLTGGSITYIAALHNEYLWK